MCPSKSTRQRIAFWAVLALAGVALYVGWRSFWFLTDDAHIVFRYVSNSVLGHGYTWNPPPFLPVEGYTCFAWVVLLDLTWRVTGVQPPEAANWLSLVFTFGTLLLAAWAALRLRLHPRLEKARLALLGAVLLGCLTNRTFLAWSSSGLETGLFNFCFTLWIVITVFSRGFGPRWLFGVSLSASLVYLCRPDGLLVLAATLILTAASLVARIRAGRLGPRWFLALSPLGLAIAHLAWRRGFYGEWLPNTYYAKQVAAWPESGVRYFASFVLEYGLWFWLAALAAAAIAGVVRALRARRDDAAARSATEPVSGLGSGIAFTPGPGLCTFVAASTVLVHVGYYTLVVGGDHFEYRVYSHLIPFVFLSFVWSLDRLRLRATPALGLCVLFLLVSLPVPWTHWARTHHLETRDRTLLMTVPVADVFPAPVRWYGQAFDDLQAWLIDRLVCIRHQEHKVFCALQVQMYPRRDQAENADFGPFPVHVFACVGVPAWVLPRVAILDTHGLSDWVVARTPLLPGQRRAMAHDRHPPPGYVESFEPNVGLRAPGELVARRRHPEMTADRIRALETRWRRWVFELAPRSPR